VGDPVRATVRGVDRAWYQVGVDAFWFRGKAGRPTAHRGTLWDSLSGGAQPPDLAEMLARWDGRYGGNCIARWDGTRLWGPDTPEDIEAALEFLRPALDAFPAIPAGYEGWWSLR
jgi:hypothetical protein